MVGATEIGSLIDRDPAIRAGRPKIAGTGVTVLHEQWIASGREHSGIILAFQQRYSIGEQLRRLLHLLNRKPAAEMMSRLEYLSTWGR
jgi:hypothetical protein